MKRIFFAMREVQLEDLYEQKIEEFMAAMDSVSKILFRNEKRRRERERPHYQLSTKKITPPIAYSAHLSIF